MSETLFSIIIVNYNGKQYLDACLRSVSKTKCCPFEVIFVDNASTDGSLQFVKGIDYLPHMTIIRNRTNLGFTGGNNEGLKYARGKYIVFLNNDTEVDENWLHELSCIFQSDSTIGAAQSKLLRMNDKTVLDSAGGLIDCFAIPITRGSNEKDYGQFNDVVEIFWAMGAALAVRHDLLNKIGSFDDYYFFNYEEIDLCWRIWLSGHKVVYVPKSVVFHVGGGTLKLQTLQQKSRAVYYFNRNQVVTLFKNYAAYNLGLYLPIWIFGKLISDIIFSSNDPVRTKGFLDILKNLNSILKKRVIIQQYIRTQKDDEIFNRSIIMPFDRHRI